MMFLPKAGDVITDREDSSVGMWLVTNTKKIGDMWHIHAAHLINYQHFVFIWCSTTETGRIQVIASIPS